MMTILVLITVSVIPKIIHCNLFSNEVCETNKQIASTSTISSFPIQ